MTSSRQVPDPLLFPKAESSFTALLLLALFAGAQMLRKRFLPYPHGRTAGLATGISKYKYESRKDNV